MKKNDKAYLVYIHKNKINNKVYVGITSQTPKDRWRNGKGYKPKNSNRNAHFWNAIQKYGWDNFYHYIIIEKITKERACEIEVNLINYYNSRNPKYGYNISNGGELGNSNEVYVYNKMTGKYINTYINNPLASRELGVSASSISGVASGKNKYCGDYYFSYINYGDSLPQNILFDINYNNNNNTPVAQYDLNGNFIKKYSRKIEAIHELFGNDCCNKLFDLNSKTAYGYIWKPCKMDEILIKKIDETELKSIITPKYNGCYQYDLNGKFLRRFNTFTDACLYLGNMQISRLSKKAKVIGKYKNSYWAREDDPRVKFGEDLDVSFLDNEIKIPSCCKKVYQYDFQGNLVNMYNSLAEAGRLNNYSADSIYFALKGVTYSYKGYIWRYNETIFRTEELLDIIEKSRKLRFIQINENTIVNEYSTSELKNKYKKDNNYKNIKISCITNDLCLGYTWKIA